MRKIILSLLLLGFASQSYAAEIRPDTILGKYKVSATVYFQKVYLNFNVTSDSEFEIQRVRSNGKQEEVCKGTYKMNAAPAWDFLLASNKFDGEFVCPSKPNKTVDFHIDFQDRTTEDLVQGTTVTVTSSLAPGVTVNASIKKQ